MNTPAAEADGPYCALLASTARQPLSANAASISVAAATGSTLESGSTAPCLTTPVSRTASESNRIVSPFIGFHVASSPFRPMPNDHQTTAISIIQPDSADSDS